MNILEALEAAYIASMARIERLEAENTRLRDLPRKIMARGGTIGEVCLAMTQPAPNENEVERILRALAKEPTDG